MSVQPSEQHHQHLFIGGRWVAPSSERRITVVSPNTGDVVGSVPEAVESDVDAAVDAARTAFDDPTGWSHLPPAARAAALRRFADALESRKDLIARTVSSQNGMPIAVASQLEAVYPVTLLRYYAGIIEGQSDDIRDGMFGGRVAVLRDPIGVVGAIVPWNFPQTLAFFKIAPALAAGCTLVVKPSPETVLDMVAVAEAAIDAGLPPGVLNIVPAGREAGVHLVEHPGVDKIAFTGSTEAGRRIAETCGRLLRPATLELGGKSATIILDDAELDLAKIGNELFVATLANNGQTCFLGTRILAPNSRYAEVVDVFTAFASSMAIGHSLDPGTQIGPMVSEAHLQRVESYIAKGQAEGGRITTGGCRPAHCDAGWFIEPTIFSGVDNNATIAQAEIFGPVLSVISYRDDDDAVRIANDSDFGLGGTVWTSDPDRGYAVAGRVRTGSIGINRYIPDPVAPFGGIKDSGMGRELGPEGLAGYQHLKSVYFSPALTRIRATPASGRFTRGGKNTGLPSPISSPIRLQEV